MRAVLIESDRLKEYGVTNEDFLDASVALVSKHHKDTEDRLVALHIRMELAEQSLAAKLFRSQHPRKRRKSK